MATEQIKLKITGMGCGGCVAAVTEALNGLQGVKNASVTLEPPEAVVNFDSNQVTPAQMTAATEKAGYTSEVI